MHLTRYPLAVAVALLLAAAPVRAQPKAGARQAGADPAATTPALAYTLAMPAPQTHYYEVRLDLKNLKTAYTDLKMPVWAPGSYLVREFARHVERLRATAPGGAALRVEKINKNTWRVQHPGQTAFTVSYGVYAFELSVRTSYLDADHGFVLPSSVLVYPALFKNAPSRLTVQPAAGWNVVSTSLRPVVGGPRFTYRAANYDELADSPIEIGNQKLLDFTAAGTPHQMAMFGPYTLPDPARLLADMQKVTEAAQAVVGQNPLDRYVFIVHHTESGGGGLEHLFSTTLGARPGTYANETAYRNFLRLVAHEYFHLWNVKRIRPIALGPFDYDRENYTRMLWVSEGQTEYMANQLTQRAGFFTPQEYYDHLAKQIGAVENQPGSRLQPVSEASFDAWIKLYRPNENSANTSISYYDKGELIGMLLDLMIVQSTQGQKHLDDVFRLLYAKYYQGLRRGFTDQEYQDAVAQVAGRRFDDFFRNVVYGVRPPDYAAALAAVGLRLTSAPASDRGSLGAGLGRRGDAFVVGSVERDGAAWAGGLNVNDEILQLNGAAPTEETLKQVLFGSAPGTPVRLQVKRGGQPRELNLTLQADPDRQFVLGPDPAATPAQQRLLARWLGR